MENWTHSTPNPAAEKGVKTPLDPKSTYVAAALLATASITNAAPALAQAAPEVEPELDEATQIAAAPVAVEVTEAQSSASVETAAPVEWAESTQPVETAYGTPLQLGSQGGRVSDLQRQLNAWGYGVTVDGDFGPQTYRAVTVFQAQQNLVQDGVVGPSTAPLLAASQANSQADPQTSLQTPSPSDFQAGLYSSGAVAEAEPSTQLAHQAPVVNRSISQPEVISPVVQTPTLQAPAQHYPVQHSPAPANKVKTINIKRSPKPAPPAPTLHLEPFNLVYLAYQGYFRDQGIPSLGAFADAAYRRRITPEDLIRAAAAQNRLSEDLLQDDGYVNAVRAAIRGILADRSET